MISEYAKIAKQRNLKLNLRLMILILMEVYVFHSKFTNPATEYI